MKNAMSRRQFCGGMLATATLLATGRWKELFQSKYDLREHTQGFFDCQCMSYAHHIGGREFCIEWGDGEFMKRSYFLAEIAENESYMRQEFGVSDFEFARAYGHALIDTRIRERSSKKHVEQLERQQ
jgi:hypothetical protein